MIQVHKDLRKHLYEGVAMENGNQEPVKLMIVGFHELKGKTTFDLSDRFIPGTPVESRELFHGPVIYRDVSPERLYRNLTEYRKEKIRANDERIKMLEDGVLKDKTEIEECNERISRILETEFFERVLTPDFIRITEEYQKEKKMSVSCFKRFFGTLKDIDSKISRLDEKLNKARTGILEKEKELKALKESNLKMERKERSRKIRKNWSVKKQLRKEWGIEQ